MKLFFHIIASESPQSTWPKMMMMKKSTMLRACRSYHRRRKRENNKFGEGITTQFSSVFCIYTILLHVVQCVCGAFVEKACLVYPKIIYLESCKERHSVIRQGGVLSGNGCLPGAATQRVVSFYHFMIDICIIYPLVGIMYLAYFW
mmetsp:Transcript_5214/g.10990  ORF Transcript_5214/g.10990 Transcript_5214/m.10990 type:complete len:146 (-) Transcript_5214:51-488(-)